MASKLTRSFWPLVAVALAAVGSRSLVLGGAPVLSDPLAAENGSARVKPLVPVGKTLVLPLLASDADGDVLSFSVKSSNPKIMARVRTGCPILKIHVSYKQPGDPTHFAGDMEFQLFRDATPVTSGVIGGAAQGGFYDDLIFHRVIPGFIIQTGDPAGTGSGEPGFSIQHEFRPELIFSGRGQLAMANSNGGHERGNPVTGTLITLGNFDPTNSSQFFVTIDQPRHLDFKHTIFGQLIRGFDLLDKIVAVPTNADGMPNTSDDNKPTVPVKMETATLTPGQSDATLLISARDAGSATLTVTAIDPSGAKAIRNIVVTAKKDTVNDPPLLKPIPNLISPVGVAPALPLKGFDLEHDYLLYAIASAGGDPTPGAFGSPQLTNSFSPRATAGFQNLALGVAGFNDPSLDVGPTVGNPFAPFDPYRFQVAEIGYGDRVIVAEAVTVEGSAAVPLTDVILAEFQDADPAGGPLDFTATVNWGDGSAQEKNTAAAPKIKIERSAKSPGALAVKGTHTYSRPGVFPIEVIVDGALGAVARTHGQAAIFAAGETLRPIGLTLSNAGATLHDRVLATFTDPTLGVGADDFSARIDWGDGAASPGRVVANGPGRFAVQGKHTYRDPETFAVYVHVARTAPAAEAVAWSRVQVSGFKAPRHLPPFPAAHLVGALSPASDDFKETKGTGANSETRFAVSIVLANSGNVASKEGEMRFYLSKDGRLNATDIPLKIGPFEEANIPVIRAGGLVNYNLVASTGSNGQPQDFRLIAPKGVTGASYFLLAHLDYSDPLADQLPITKDVIFGRLNGINVKKRSLAVTEATGSRHTATFKVVLDGKPGADVKLKLQLSTDTEILIDKTELTFTKQNWDQPQVVTVTAKDDTIVDGTKRTEIFIGPGESSDVAWNGMSGGTVNVLAADNDSATN